MSDDKPRSHRMIARVWLPYTEYTLGELGTLTHILLPNARQDRWIDAWRRALPGIRQLERTTQLKMARHLLFLLHHEHPEREVHREGLRLQLHRVTLGRYYEPFGGLYTLLNDPAA